MTSAVIHSLIVCCLPTDLLPVSWISCRLLPAPDLLPGSLLRLACPATLSSLVLDPCLLTLINKLLQMDLTESDESQQHIYICIKEFYKLLKYFNHYAYHCLFFNYTIIIDRILDII